MQAVARTSSSLVLLLQRKSRIPSLNSTPNRRNPQDGTISRLMPQALASAVGRNIQSPVHDEENVEQRNAIRLSWRCSNINRPAFALSLPHLPLTELTFGQSVCFLAGKSIRKRSQRRAPRPCLQFSATCSQAVHVLLDDRQQHARPFWLAITEWNKDTQAKSEESRSCRRRLLRANFKFASVVSSHQPQFLTRVRNIKHRTANPSTCR